MSATGQRVSSAPKQRVTSAPQKERLTSAHGKAERPPSGQKSSGAPAPVLLIGLTSGRAWLDSVSQQLRASGFPACFEATEAAPRSLRARARLVQGCGSGVVLAEARLQRSPLLMELLNYAHSSGLPLAVLLVQKFYEPSGALAAIGTAHECVLSGETADWPARLSGHLSAKARAVKAADSVNPADDSDEKQLTGAEPAARAGGSGVFLSYQPDGEHSVALIEGRLRQLEGAGGAPVRCRPDRRNREAIEACRVFVAVMSPGYEASADSLHDLDFARLRRKEVIPVTSVPRGDKWRPSGWLSLVVAGRLYHRLYDAAAAAEKHYDSSPMEDFAAAVMLALQERPTEEEAEAAEVRALTSEVDVLKAELQQLGGAWPPAPKQPSDALAQGFQHLTVEDSLPKTQTDLPYTVIEYSVTRMSLEPPKPLFDARGVPIARSFDVMLSYQWDSQDLVRKFREQLSVYTVEAWMDIWGGMQGNVNESMARAVESSRMLICFLTAKYQTSANCLLELKYALRRDRPVLFLKVEAGVRPLDWVAALMARSVVISFGGMSEANELDNGVPKLVRIIETVKKVSVHEAGRPRRREDVSEEIFQLERLINAAKDAIHELKGTQRFSTCSRCSAKFDPTSVAPDACAKHAAYYVGGTLMAGRWVCCSQTDTGAPGCSKAPHISEKREWETITGGAKKWVPE